MSVTASKYNYSPLKKSLKNIANPNNNPYCQFDNDSLTLKSIDICSENIIRSVELSLLSAAENLMLFYEEYTIGLFFYDGERDGITTGTIILGNWRATTLPCLNNYPFIIQIKQTKTILLTN